MNKKVNWGIIGLGNIAMNFAKAIQLTDNAILKGISSKNKKKISNFKDLFGVKSEYCFDNYEDLINCSEIEAIYIALPNSMHYDFIVKCIEAKKKLLVEKPATKNFLEIKSIKEKYNINKFFYSEGFMYFHHPQILDVIQILKKRLIGNLITIKSKFGNNILKKKNFLGKEILKKQDINNRLFNKDLGGGVILDLGCYPTSFCILVASLYFNLDINKIKVNINSKQFGTTGVEIDSSASISFNNIINAEVETSFIRNIGSESEIIGDKGKLLIRDTWQGSSSINLILDNKNKEILNDAKNNCYYYQIKNISNSILNKMSKPDQPIMDFEKSYINMSILEKWKNNEK